MVTQAWEVEARIWEVVVYASHLLLRTRSVHLYKALVSVISGVATPKQREGDKLSLIMLMMMLMMILMMMLMLMMIMVMLKKSDAEVTVTGALLGVHLCSSPEVRCLLMVKYAHPVDGGGGGHMIGPFFIPFISF